MLTVLLAAHNSARTLRSVLDAQTRLESPAGGWREILINNASTDETVDIAKAYSSRLPIEIVCEKRRGKNIALNTGLTAVTGDLVVFTDDDIIPRTDWLVQLRLAADRSYDYDIFGGVIEPLWPRDVPVWLGNAFPLAVVFAITPDVLAEGPIHPGMVWGGNMAVRQRVFAAGHRFDESVGPAHGQYRMGSETEFAARMAREGYKAWHVSSARVRHVIRPEQFEPRWLIRRAYRFGRAMYRQEYVQFEPGMRMLFGMPRWPLRRIAHEIKGLMVAWIRRDFEEQLRRRWKVALFRGYLREAREVRSAARRISQQRVA